MSFVSKSRGTILPASPPSSAWAAKSIEKQLSLPSPVSHRNCAFPFLACRLGKRCKPRREQFPRTIRCGKERQVNECRCRSTHGQRHLPFAARDIRQTSSVQVPVSRQPAPKERHLRAV